MDPSLQLIKKNPSNINYNKVKKLINSYDDIKDILNIDKKTYFKKYKKSDNLTDELSDNSSDEYIRLSYPYTIKCSSDNCSKYSAFMGPNKKYLCWFHAFNTH